MTTFDFQGLTLRAVEIDGDPWFVAVDVARMLGMSEAQVAYHMRSTLPPRDVTLLKRNEIRGEPSELVWVRDITRNGLNIISEAALYTFGMRAQRKNPKAREFQDWVTGTVLPAIRKDGGYIKGEDDAAQRPPEGRYSPASVSRTVQPEIHSRPSKGRPSASHGLYVPAYPPVSPSATGYAKNRGKSARN